MPSITEPACPTLPTTKGKLRVFPNAHLPCLGDRIDVSLHEHCLTFKNTRQRPVTLHLFKAFLDILRTWTNLTRDSQDLLFLKSTPHRHLIS